MITTTPVKVKDIDKMMTAVAHAVTESSKFDDNKFLGETTDEWRNQLLHLARMRLKLIISGKVES